jgi:hypothetical protein
MNCEKAKPVAGPSAVEPDTTATLSEFISALEDPEMREYLKSSLGITDEQLKAHIQRLIDATAVQTDPKPGKK